MSEAELAWSSLYRRHQMTLVSFACKRGYDEHEAWDVVQELFLRMFRQGSIAKISSLTEDLQRGWLMNTLRWIICNQHRDRARAKRGSTQMHESLDELLDGGFEVAGHGSPASEYDRRWALSMMERGLERLRAGMKPAAWATFEASFWGGASTSTPAMRVACHRARLRLRALILRECTEASLHQAASGQN